MMFKKKQVKTANIYWFLCGFMIAMLIQSVFFDYNIGLIEPQVINKVRGVSVGGDGFTVGRVEGIVSDVLGRVGRPVRTIMELSFVSVFGLCVVWPLLKKCATYFNRK